MKMTEHALQLLRDLSDAPGASGFEDAVVQAARPYAAAIDWAAQTGLVSGYGDGKFGIEDNLTVEQMAVILWKQAGKPAAAAVSESVKHNDWSAEALGWCAADCDDATFSATRTQIFQMLANSKK